MSLRAVQHVESATPSIPPAALSRTSAAPVRFTAAMHLASHSTHAWHESRLYVREILRLEQEPLSHRATAISIRSSKHPRALETRQVKRAGRSE